MKFIVCTVDVNPCPEASQALVAASEMLDFAALGITPEAIFKVMAWGFSSVLGVWLVGYVLAIAIGLIRKS